jgi:hypothetical protein
MQRSKLVKTKMGRKTPRFKISTLHAGLFTGLWVAVAQAFVGVTPPSVYGICMVNHPRDLVDWSLNNAFGTNFFIHGASIDIPVLTVIGIVGGSLFATVRNKEFSFRKAKAPLYSATYGFLVAIFGLLLGFCSVHIIMGVAYGSLIAFIGLPSMIIGVFFAIKFVRWRARH